MVSDKETLLQKHFKNAHLNNFKMKSYKKQKKSRNLMLSQDVYLLIKLVKNIKRFNKGLINHLHMNRN